MAYLSAFLAGLMAVTAPAADDQKAAEAALCQGEAMSIFLPDDETIVAPNISLAQFQYKSEGDPCGRNISRDELMRLYGASKLLTVSSFSASKKSFALFVKYELTTDGSATLQMKASIPQAGNAELGSYYDKAVTLTNYHSQKGTVEVFFRYEISPLSVKVRAPKRGG